MSTCLTSFDVTYGRRPGDGQKSFGWATTFGAGLHVGESSQVRPAIRLEALDLRDASSAGT